MSHAVILVGTGRYSDPWHHYPETSQRIAATLEQAGISANLAPTTAAGLADLPRPDLLIVDAGGGDTSTLEPIPLTERSAWSRAHGRLTEILDSRVPLLGVHAAVNAFVDVPAFRRRLGGHWETGHSFHPDRGPATFTAASDHPILKGLTTIEVDDDERYSALTIDSDVTPLLTHETDGTWHVAAWARESPDGRAVYDGLGHYGPSYDTLARGELLVREATWLLGTVP